MSALKVLYVTGGPTELDLVREISWDKKRGTFVGTGDGATAVHAGRQGPVTGKVIVEDLVTAETIIAAAKIASAVFTCAADTGNATVTVTGFLATGQSARVGDGTKDSEPVTGFEVPFIADSLAVAAAAGG